MEDHESTTRSGEDVTDSEQEEGREKTGEEGGAGRPTGTSDPRDSTGVNPQDTITDTPDQPSGDQGG